MTSWAFAGDVNPLGAKLRSLFSSDIGHWDVPVLADVAWEAQGRRTQTGSSPKEDFRDFVFSNPARFWTSGNRDFFVQERASKTRSRLVEVLSTESAQPDRPTSSRAIA